MPVFSHAFADEAVDVNARDGVVAVGCRHAEEVAGVVACAAPPHHDAVAIGKLTPGPVLLLGTFIGYLRHRVLGALVATVSIFAAPFPSCDGGEGI